MFFRQILNDDLGCGSYLIADGGEAAVIDPKWEIDAYLRLAEEHGFRITHIFETHNHADHLSGHGRLAEVTGAAIHVSQDADVAYDHSPLGDGDVVGIGQTRITARATPGHRPEHLAYLVEDRTRAETPWVLVTGDSLFVGDLARPDLAVEAEEGAGDLFRSLHRLLELDDFSEVWPGHIGGSMCGGPGMSEKPTSTVGYERRFNPLLQISDEQEFVRELTAQQAPQPPNFKRIVGLNRGPLISAAAPVEPLSPERLKALMHEGAVLVDGRSPREYDAFHISGSLNVNLTQAGVGTRTAWVVDPESDVVVTADSDEAAAHLARLLHAVGILTVRGYLAGGVQHWQAAGHPVEATTAIDVPHLADALQQDTVRLLDVRETAEWEQGHVRGALHVPYHDLGPCQPEDLQGDSRPLAVACSAGVRSALATSVLRRLGVENVQHVVDGGVADLAACGVELTREG